MIIIRLIRNFVARHLRGDVVQFEFPGFFFLFTPHFNHLSERFFKNNNNCSREDAGYDECAHTNRIHKKKKGNDNVITFDFKQICIKST